MEMVVEALTGLRFSVVSLIGLALFYGAGVWFGRLTRNISLLKLLLAAIVTYYGFTLLVNAPGAFIIAFIIGLATNHISFTMEAIYWAEDISDFLYALRNPEAFEDIREAEQAGTGEERHQSRWGNDSSKRARADSGKSRTDNNTNKSRSSHDHRIDKDKLKPPNPNEKYYRILGLDPNGTYTKADIKRAYRKQALKTHPDTGGSAEAFRKVGEAYEWLMKKNCV